MKQNLKIILAQSKFELRKNDMANSRLEKWKTSAP
jgi:hypothetical protein